MNNDYRITKVACYFGYICQALVCFFYPLLYVHFHDVFNLSFTSLAVLSLLLFVIQLGVDIFSTLLINKFGFKKFAVTASISIIIGFGLLSILPYVMDPFFGIFISLLFTSFGGGLIEGVISPTMDKISDNNPTVMGLLHGMFAFGGFFTIIICFIFYLVFGIENWRILSLIMMSIPVTSLILFSLAKYPSVTPSEKYVVKDSKPYYKKSVFWIILLGLLFGGASEVGMSQWISTYSEVGLGVVKPYGDIFGPALFCLFQGIFRVICAFSFKKIKVENLLIIAGIVAFIGYILATLPNNGVVNFIGAIIVAIGIAPMWPGCLSLFSEKVNDDSPRLFTMGALFGDIGCVVGVYTIGALADSISFKYAILVGSILPILFLVSMVTLKILTKNKNK